MLTFRSNTSLKLHAAYCGMVRVGYVEKSTKGDWTWWLQLLRPSGGGYSGRRDTLDEAKQAISDAMRQWTVDAGLTASLHDATQTRMDI